VAGAGHQKHWENSKNYGSVSGSYDPTDTVFSYLNDIYPQHNLEGTIDGMHTAAAFSLALIVTGTSVTNNGNHLFYLINSIRLLVHFVTTEMGAPCLVGPTVLWEIEGAELRPP
jgi:hypothetical protein